MGGVTRAARILSTRDLVKTIEESGRKRKRSFGIGRKRMTISIEIVEIYTLVDIQTGNRAYIGSYLSCACAHPNILWTMLISQTNRQRHAETSNLPSSQIETA
jgi:hypothetical protein